MQPESLPKHHFTYQTLDVYQLAVKVNRWFGRARFPRGRSALRDQGQRAADAMVCNIAEGVTKGSSASLNTALGEAGECHAVLDCVSLPGSEEQQRNLRRIAAMLARMSR